VTRILLKLEETEKDGPSKKTNDSALHVKTRCPVWRGWTISLNNEIGWRESLKKVGSRVNTEKFGIPKPPIGGRDSTMSPELGLDHHFYDVIKITSPKLRHQNDVTIFFHF